MELIPEHFKPRQVIQVNACCMKLKSLFVSDLTQNDNTIINGWFKTMKILHTMDTPTKPHNSMEHLEKFSQIDPHSGKSGSAKSIR